MQISDELLMRYADGELEPIERARVEDAVRADPTLSRRVTAFRAQRDRLAKALASELEEPVPDRLRMVVERAAVAAPPKIADLNERRTRNRLAERILAWSWPEAGALAASLLLGALIAQQVGQNRAQDTLRTSSDGLVAGPAIAQALSTQLASRQSPTAEVRVGLTFENQRGELCRTFADRAAGLSGIACRSGREWRVGMALSGASSRPGDEPGTVRTAGSEISPDLLAAVEAQIRGEPLDATAEAKALQNDWRPPGR
jgi:hypothetical protein